MDRRQCLLAVLVVLSSVMPAASMAGERPTQSAQVSAAMDFLNAIGAGDFDGAGEYLDETAMLDLPYAGNGISEQGRA